MTWLLFLAFLGYTAWQRYFSAGQAADQAYVTNAAFVLAITMVLPFLVSWLFTRATLLTGRTPALLIGFITSVSLSVTGYWVLWKYFSGVSDIRLPVEQALMMGLLPGLIMGLILAAGTLLTRRA
jgi:Na+(H+)/acetate symporter ActP